MLQFVHHVHYRDVIETNHHKRRIIRVPSVPNIMIDFSLVYASIIALAIFLILCTDNALELLELGSAIVLRNPA